MRRRVWLGCAAVAVLCCGIGLLGAASAAPARDTLIIGASVEPSTLSPLFGNETIGDIVNGALFAGVIELDKNWHARPVLVETLPTVENGLWKIAPGGSMQVTWKLRKGLRWQDGQPITAEDAIFTHHLVMDDKLPIRTRDLDRRIENMYAPDPYTIVSTFKEPYAQANRTITEIGVLPRHILEPLRRKGPEAMQQYGIDPAVTVGSGAFRLREWRHGTEIVLEANPGYFRGRPKLARVVIRFITDTNTLFANLIAGQVDATPAFGITFDQGLELQDMQKQGRAPGLHVYMTPGDGFEQITINMDNPILRDKRVRQALLYGMNRDEMSRVLFRGQQAVAHSFLPLKHYGFLKDIRRYDYSPDKARALLGEAGWRPGPDGILRNDRGDRFSIQIETTAGRKVREQVEQILQAEWRQLGVDLQVHNEPGRVMYGDTIPKRKWPGLIMFFLRIDPFYIPEPLFASYNIPSAANNFGGQNIGGWKSQDADRLVQAMAGSLNVKEQTKLFYDFQRLWADELPQYGLFNLVDVSVVRDGVRNWNPIGEETISPITRNAYEWEWAPGK